MPGNWVTRVLHEARHLFGPVYYFNIIIKTQASYISEVFIQRMLHKHFCL